jgi:hypothetical protein
MAKLTLTVNDDGAQAVTGNVNNLSNSTYVFTSTTAGSYDYIGFRFTGVTVPNAATIRRAVLKVNLTSISSTAGTFNIKAEASDNAPALSTTADDMATRTYSAGTATRVHDLDNGIKYLDVTAEVQAIVNRAGWASGNAIHLSFQNGWISSCFTVSMLESATDPQLSIVYDGSTSEATFGSHTGSYTNGGNASADDGSYATMTNDTSSTHTFYNFGFAIPSDATIDDILVKANLKVSSITSRSKFGMQLSVDGGTAWSTIKYTNQVEITDVNVFWGADPDTWDVFPTVAQVNDNTNFRIRITNDLVGGTNDPSIDYIAVNVLYTAGGVAQNSNFLMFMGPQPQQ